MKRNGYVPTSVTIASGVVGIVIAMTIGVIFLLKWHAYRQDATVKFFESRVANAVSQMHAQDRLHYRSTEDFVDEFKKYLKTDKDCKVNPAICFTHTINNGETYRQFAQFNKTWGTNIVGMKFSNGINALILYNPDCTLDFAATGLDVAECTMAAIYDTNGPRGPNIMGKDVRTFNVKPIKCTNGEDGGWDILPGGGVITSCNVKFNCAVGGKRPEPANSYDDCWSAAQRKCHSIGASLPSKGMLDTNNYAKTSETEAGKLYKYCHRGDQKCSPFYWLGDSPYLTEAFLGEFDVLTSTGLIGRHYYGRDAMDTIQARCVK